MNKLLKVVLVSALLGAPSASIAAKSAIHQLEGTWGWGNCEAYKHRVRVSRNREFYEFVGESGPYYYFIAGRTRNGIKVVLLYEDLFDDAGNPVSWHIVFDGPDTYYWLRSDRRTDDLRGPIKRCKS